MSPPPSPSPLPAAIAPWAAGALAMAAHLVVLQDFPYNFAYDGFQRWGARDHILVQSWLPFTQTLIWGVSRISEDLLLVRLLLSVLASLGVGLWAAFAEKVGGPVAGWCVVAAATFGPFTVWSSTLYLEGPFFALLAGGLLAVAHGRTTLADLLMGSLALVRYEGWPFVLIYALWRGWQHRDLWVLRSFWGMALWLTLKGIFGVQGHNASPIDYDDWEGMGQRLTAWSLAMDVGHYGKLAARAGATVWGIGGLVAALLIRRMPQQFRPYVLLLDLLLTCQLAITVAWIAGLETAIRRMLVLPGMLSAALLGLGLAWVWPRLPRWSAAVGVLAALWGLGYGIWDSWDSVQDERWQVRFELAALEQMAECPDCVWWVEPRTGMGTRDRHDGCEAMQGLSILLHDQELRCARWIRAADWPTEQAECTASVVWNSEAELYEVQLGRPNRPLPPPDSPLMNLQPRLNAESAR